ncbi:hypothetical protein PENTCL1PPCAC_28676 [Pristionchus entomophagus]|uniref:BAH domain-containing protein n=1 Tax=Pristionchus entomophagus TaxID=358040 RepID=A0AAV5UHR5_9BILA|nr:hypothetical protein PENTCL1PPCAC_28676 [Pristionchus entomophagus]
MQTEIKTIAPGSTNLEHPFVDAGISILPESCDGSYPHSFSTNFMTPLTPIETMDHPPNTLSPPYTPSASLSSHSSQSSPHRLILSPKDYAPIRAFRQRENVNYSEVKRRETRVKKSDNVKPIVVSTLSKKKNHKVKIRCGEWEANGKSTRKRVYINNSTGGQFRPCLDEVRRKKDSLILREGDDVTAITEDDDGERIVGVARVTRIYVAQKNRDLHAAVLWYYLPSQVEDDTITALPNEIFPSRHLDSLPLRSIEMKVEVLNTSQYIQLISSLARSKTFPFSCTEKVKKEENTLIYFARFPYDCVRKRIMIRERKGI